MRISDVLSKAPDTSRFQIEGFLGRRKVSWGQPRSVKAGKVFRNYPCRTCGDVRTFSSGTYLSCLVTGHDSVSIDATLRCVGCNNSREVWFLIECADDLFSLAPTVCVKRFIEAGEDSGNENPTHDEVIDQLFQKAQLAFDGGLGAGAMVYLRKIFELTTKQTAETLGISIKGSGGRKKPFKILLQEVDSQQQIIPQEFSSNGYKLFGELSEIIHDDTTEHDALSKYGPCKRLIFGIVNNVRNKHEFADAQRSLGWESSSESEASESNS